MAEDRAQFQARLFGTFVKEAAVHLAAMPVLLDRLEQEPGGGEGGDAGGSDAARDLLREIHSLKGAAGAVEQSQVEFLCRALEQLAAKLVRGECAADATFLEAFRSGLALLGDGLAQLTHGGTFTVSLQFLQSMRKLM